MDISKRELITNRLLFGVYRITCGAKQYFVKAPSPKVRYLSNLYYNEIMEDVFYNKWYTRSECVNLLVQQGLLDKGVDEKLSLLYKQLEVAKINLYDAFSKGMKMDLFKRSVDNARNQINQIESMKVYYDRYTLEGYCEIAKSKYILSHCLFNEQGKKIKVGEIELGQIANNVAEESLSTGEIREVVRNEPWRTYWNGGKRGVFGKAATKWSDEQKLAVIFSTIYDNAYKSSDCPTDPVFNDDDLFDGWQLTMKKKYEEGKKDGGEQKAGNVETFKMINRVDGMGQPLKKEEIQAQIESIYGENDLEGRMKVKERQKVIMKNGKVVDADLPDNKRENNAKYTQMFIDKNKKR